MAARYQKEEDDIEEPPCRKCPYVLKEETHHKETHQQAEKRGVEKSSMPKEMIVRNTKVESDGIQIRATEHATARGQKR
jgi:hypothetical protein